MRLPCWKIVLATGTDNDNDNLVYYQVQFEKAGFGRYISAYLPEAHVRTDTKVDKLKKYQQQYGLPPEAIYYYDDAPKNIQSAKEAGYLKAEVVSSIMQAPDGLVGRLKNLLQNLQKITPTAASSAVSSTTQVSTTLFRTSQTTASKPASSSSVSSLSTPTRFLSPPTLFSVAQTLLNTMTLEVKRLARKDWDRNAAASFTATVMTALRKNQWKDLCADPELYGLAKVLLSSVKTHLEKNPGLQSLVSANPDAAKKIEVALLKNGALPAVESTVASSSTTTSTTITTTHSR